MRTATMIALFAVMLAGTAFAGDSGNGCKIQGTWVGELPQQLPDGSGIYSLKFFSVSQGTGDTEGTDLTEWINPVPAPGTSWSNVRGIWKKSGPKTYSFTGTGYIYLTSTGTIVAAIRHTGTATLIDCDTMEIKESVETLDADMKPIACVPGIVLTVHRALLQEPCEP